MVGKNVYNSRMADLFIGGLCTVQVSSTCAQVTQRCELFKRRRGRALSFERSSLMAYFSQYIFRRMYWVEKFFYFRCVFEL